MFRERDEKWEGALQQREAEFILEPLTDAMVKVTHRPYTWTTLSSQLRDDGIDGGLFHYTTPDDAPKALCAMLLVQQRVEDSRRINPEERKAAARRVLREFLNEQPG